MSDGLNLFPAHVPIGRAQLPNGPDGRPGAEIQMLGSAEFLRALVKLFERIGGPNGMSNEELALLATLGTPSASGPTSGIRDIEQQLDTGGQAASLREMRKAIDELRAAGDSCRAEVAALRKSLGSVEMEATYRDQFRVNWERPGRIGSLTPNTGAFTLLSATGTATFGTTGAGGRIQLKRASDGVVVGTDAMVGNTREIDNQAGDIVLKRGSTERLRVAAAGAAVSGTFSVTGQLTVSTATGNPPFIVASTTQVINLYAERAGEADHAANADVLTSGTAYPADATDLPTAITLVNAIKAANLSKNV